MKVEDIIRMLGIERMEREGAYFKKNFRSHEVIPAGILENHDKPRIINGGIYFMHIGESCSRMHLLKSDEIYHFLLGNTVLITILRPDGTTDNIRLGQNILEGELLQYKVPGGCWHGSRLLEGEGYALMGTVMSPDFEDEDYTDVDDLPNGIDDLIAKYPDQECEIRKLEKAKF
ncbi:MAG: cupin domain-containing protein [Saccharofermentanales bacterium]|jgi:predicted cupin superfamily sugar epimerase